MRPTASAENSQCSVISWRWSSATRSPPERLAAAARRASLAVERLQQVQQRRDIAGLGDLVDQRLRGIDDAAQPFHGRAILVVLADQVLDLAMLQQLDAVGDDVEPKLDLVLGHAAAGNGEGTDALLEARILGGRLADQPGHVVARNLVEGVLTFDDQRRNIDGGGDEQRDHDASAAKRERIAPSINTHIQQVQYAVRFRLRRTNRYCTLHCPISARADGRQRTQRRRLGEPPRASAHPCSAHRGRACRRAA